VRKSEEAEGGDKTHRNRRRGSKGSPEGKRPNEHKPKAENQPKEKQPKPEGQSNPAKRSGKRPNYYHRRKPKSGGNQQGQS
jgi:hypothetical protein